MRLVFAGTPEAAVPALRAVAASRHELLAVVTRPDAPAGRGRRVTRSPVGQWADQHGVPVLQPRRPSEPAFLEELARLAPDCCPIVAYGALVPRAALDIPRHGWVNLHFSLLPAWRGAAPVQRAVMAGDEVTGASTFRLEEGLDTGPVYGVLTEAVKPADTAGDLLARLAGAGAGLLVSTLDGIEDGDLVARPQPAEGISLAPKVTVEEARVDWAQPPHVVDRRIRGCTPAPGAWTTFRGERLKLGPLRRAGVLPGTRDLPDATSSPGPAATAGVADPPEGLSATRDAVVHRVGGAVYVLGDVQPEGKRRMPAVEWARGVRLGPGERFA